MLSHKFDSELSRQICLCGGKPTAVPTIVDHSDVGLISGGPQRSDKTGQIQLNAGLCGGLIPIQGSQRETQKSQRQTMTNSTIFSKMLPRSDRTPSNQIPSSYGQ
jgi:hypothetical protein